LRKKKTVDVEGAEDKEDHITREVLKTSTLRAKKRIDRW